MANSLLLVTVVMVAPVTLAAIIDLTHTYDKNVLYPPVGPNGSADMFNFTIMQRGYDKKLDQWLEFNWIGMFEHGGTHMDAPAHCAQGRKHLHEVPVEQFIGSGVMIDMTSQAKQHPDYLMTIQDIKNWEGIHGEIPQGAIVMMNTGKHKLYPNRKLFFGTETPDDVTTYHNPGVDPSAATWLLHNRQIKALGTDSHSCDPGQNHNRNKCHLALLPNGVVLLEFVANLDRMPPTGSQIFLGPVKTRDGSGGPVRILSVFDEDEDSSTSNGCLKQFSYIVMPVLLLTALIC